MTDKPSWDYNSFDEDNASSESVTTEASSEETNKENAKSVFIADTEGQVFEVKREKNSQEIIDKKLAISNFSLSGRNRNRNRNQSTFGASILASVKKLRSERRESSKSNSKYLRPKRRYHSNLIEGIDYHVYKQLEQEGIMIPGISRKLTDAYVLKVVTNYLKKQWVHWKISRRKKGEVWKVSQRKLNSILKKFPTGFFTVILSPIFAYALYFFITAPNEGRTQLLGNRAPLKYLMLHPESVTLDTCNSISYLKKINWETFKRINYYPGATFICCSPDSRLATDKFFGGAFSVNQLKPSLVKKADAAKPYFVLSREFNLCFPSRKLLNFINQFNENLETSFKSKYTKSQLHTFQYFQQHFIRLDVIPTNLGNVYAFQNKTKLNPLFNQLSHTPLKRAIREKAYQKYYKLEFEPSNISHADYLRHVIIQKNPFSSPHLSNYQRFLQYKTSNCLSQFREMVGMFVHQGAIIEIQDELFEVDFYFNDVYDVDKKLAEFIANNRAIQGQVRSRDDVLNYRLLKALIEDVRHFSLPQYDNVKIKERLFDPKTNPTSEFKYDDQHLKKKLNRFNYQKENAKLLRDNDEGWLYDEYKHDYHCVLPRFQKLLFKHFTRALKQNNLTGRPCDLAFNFNPAVQTPPEIKGLRIRRCPKLSEHQKILRNRFIKAESEFVKRQLSGYVFPDSTLNDLFARQARWTNRWFIKGSDIEDDVYIKIQSPPELNDWVYKQVLKLAVTANQPELPEPKIEKKGFLNFLHKKQKPIYQPPIHEALIPYERPDSWSTTKKPLSIANMSEPNAFSNNIPLEMTGGTYHAIDESDWGIPYSQLLPEPRRFKYNKKHTLDPYYSLNRVYRDRESVVDFDQPMTFEDEDPKNLETDGQNEGLSLSDFDANKRQLPYRKQAVAPGTKSEHQTYIPKSIGYEQGQQPDLFRTHFDIGTNFNSDLKGYRINRNLSPFKYYNNRFRSRMSLRWSLKNPLFLGQIALCIYFLTIARRLYHNYSDSFYEGLEQFLLTINLQDLMAFKSLEDFVIPAKTINVNFSDMMGSYELINRFLPVILLLRSKHHWFSEIPMLDQTLSVKPKFSWDDMRNKKRYGFSERLLLRKAVEDFSQSYVYSSQIVNTGFLLVGAPGTGKTFLVKALAGETNCPIISNSNERQSSGGPSLRERSESKTTAMIRKLFKAAKFRSPSILFIDEIDSLARRRSSVLGLAEKNRLGPRLLYGRPHCVKHQALSSWQRMHIIEHKLDLNRIDAHYWSIKNPKITKALLRPHTPKQRFSASLGYEFPHFDVQYYFENLATKQTDVDNVTVLLCELDGMKARESVVVIGATNRPDVIDPALTRPGRLGEIVYLDLPNKQKRLALLKFYAGDAFTKNADWDFFASHGQTGGLSSAHLKTAMNISTLTLIRQSFNSREQQNSSKKPVLPPHSDLTIEYGINSVKFQNLYVIKATERLNRKLHKALFIPSLYELLDQPLYVFLGKDVHTVEEKSMYLVTNIDGVFVQKNAYIDPSKGADVSAPENFNKPNNLNQSKSLNQPKSLDQQQSLRQKSLQKIANKIYLKRYKQLRFCCLNTLTEHILAVEGFQNYKNVGLTHLEYLFCVLNEKTRERIRYLALDSYGNPLPLPLFNALIPDFKGYVYRHFKEGKSNVLGFILLLDTIFIVGNPALISTNKIFYLTKDSYRNTDFRWARSSRTGLINYHLLTSFQSDTLLPHSTQQCAKMQKKVLGDDLLLQRAAYYNAGKALVIGLLDDNLFDSIILTLWSQIKILEQNKFTQETFVQSLASQLVARRHFESYLLALVAGKAGEHMLLTNYQGNLPEFQNKEKGLNYSDIGLEELQQMGWLATVMVEKGLYYQLDSTFLNQTIIQTLPDALNQSHIADLKEDVGKATADLAKENSLETIPYWWQSKLHYESSTIRFSDGQWTVFYETQNEQAPMNPNKLYETPLYESGTLNTSANINTSTNINSLENKQITNLNSEQLQSLFYKGQGIGQSIDPFQSDDVQSYNVQSREELRSIYKTGKSLKSNSQPKKPKSQSKKSKSKSQPKKSKSKSQPTNSNSQQTEFLMSDLQSKDDFIVKDDLQSYYKTGKGLQLNSQPTKTNEDDFESTSNSQDAFESTSNSENDFESTSNSENDFESTSNSEDDFESTSNSEDDFESTSNNLTKTSEAKETIDFAQLNEKTINSLIESADITWNGFTSTKVEKMYGQLIFESFNKAFILLEENRSLFDLLVHEFYSHNRLTGLQAKRIVQRFLTPYKKVAHVPLELYVDYYTYVYLIYFQWYQFENTPSTFLNALFYYVGVLFKTPTTDSISFDLYSLLVQHWIYTMYLRIAINAYTRMFYIQCLFF